jgi:hypothetical protein
MLIFILYVIIIFIPKKIEELIFTNSVGTYK